ncbi:hypothetical protein [Dehalococcoides mccartyi]|uniref:hypothetical protein n=1 Tax=Dehalococcoides mccartyi TaxID=61435 RepID=UPI00241F4610|nr:hypothetical protein [Dehalococcoides mccartyi]
MKVALYAKVSENQLKDLLEFCQQQNLDFEVGKEDAFKGTKRIGRPRKAIDFNKVLEAHEIACSRVNRITKENQGYSETARILSEQTGLRITAGWVYNRIKAGN